MNLDLLYPEPPPPDQHDVEVHQHDFKSVDPDTFYVFTHNHMLDDPGHSHAPAKMLQWAKDGQGYVMKYHTGPRL